MALHSDTEIYKAVVDLAAFGLRQASHSARDRARLANAARRRGFAVDHGLTKVYA